ncbi:hypothetical protein SFRURICE_010213, partial [Spodoptera frugiperda]
YEAVRGRCAAQVCDVSKVGKPSIARIFTYKKHILTESVSTRAKERCVPFHKKHSLVDSVYTRAKLCAPMNKIGGCQTQPQQRSIAHLGWKSTMVVITK